MADRIDKSTRSRNMAAIRGTDTAPEMLVRKYLHASGFRFRLHDRKLPGRPDIVLPKYRAVVEVRGCFWHLHGCANSVIPKTRTEWWLAKLQGNKERDLRNQTELERRGWRVIVIWECEIPSLLDLLPDRIREPGIASG